MWRTLLSAALSAVLIACGATSARAQPYGATRMLSPPAASPILTSTAFPRPAFGAFGLASGATGMAPPANALPGGMACRVAIAAAERAHGVPDRLMAAIGVVESGRKDPRTGQVGPWPWTINAEGAGAYYETKAEAVAAVRALQAQGVRSIDVGCMQVNLLHHASAFASLEEAFDPAANARYAAQYLQTLMAQTGSWQKATAWYHSANPDLGEPYARRVTAAWNGQQGAAPPDVPIAGYGAAATALRPGPSAVPAVGTSLAFAGSTTARVIPLPGAQPGGAIGRGLDSYRTNPTQLAGQFLPLRPRS